MSKKKYPKELKPWSQKTTTPIEELREDFDKELAKVQTAHPELDEEKQIHRAKVIMYSRVKALLRSSAIAFAHIPIGVSGTRDMNSRRRRTLLEKYNSPTQRDEALTGDGSARVKILINPETGEETPIVVDTREWIEFERGGEKRSFKNRGFGKELAEVLVRDVISVGKIADDEGDVIKILRISAMRHAVLTYPELGYPMKTRFNAREETKQTRDLRTAAVTRWGSSTIVPGFEDSTLYEEESMYNFLGTVPNWMQSPISELDDWHALHEDDYGRAVVIEADVTFIAREPNASGNYLMIVEDAEKMDLEAQGITCFVPGELEENLKFGNGSHTRILARTSKGQGYDPETRQPMVTFDEETGEEVPVMRIILNVLNVVCDPDGKVPYEEDILDDKADEIEPQ